MNLAFVNSSYRLGGAETVMHDLIDGCEAAGHQSRLYVGHGKSYPRDPRVVPLYPRPLSRLYHSRFHASVERLAPRFAWTDRRFRELAGVSADVVHLHNFHGDYAAVESLAVVARRKPLVWTLHGHWGITGGCDHPLDCTRYRDVCGQCPRLGVWPLGRVDNTAGQLRLKIAQLADLALHVVAPSRLMADRIASSRVGRGWHVHHIPNGISTEVFGSARKRDPVFRRALGLDPLSTVICVVNRNFSDSEKGFTAVREALAAIAPAPGAIQVVLAGQGSEAAAAQLAPALRPISLGYLDSRTRLAEIFEASDIFLFASPAETFPCVILEAMASACCIVSTRTSGVTEQIADGQTGVLAATTSGTDLGRALQLVLNDAEAQARLGRAARERARTEFSIGAMIRGHLELYQQAAAHV